VDERFKYKTWLSGQRRGSFVLEINMARRLELTTGDITLSAPRMRSFSILVEDAPDEVELHFDNVSTHVCHSDWPELLAQVKTRSLAKWKFTNMSPPMGEPDFQRLLAEVNNTPSYQLFLAGFDIAETVGLASNREDQIVLSRCISLSMRIPSAVGPKGLFFLPDAFADTLGADVIKELVESNKLCKVTALVASFQPITKYYIPYATPIDLIASATPAARNAWDRVRSYFYALR
jgi:hypothetical protein